MRTGPRVCPARHQLSSGTTQPALGKDSACMQVHVWKSNSCINWGKSEALGQHPEAFCCSGGDLFFRANLAPLYPTKAEPVISGSLQGEHGDEAQAHQQGSPGLLSSLRFYHVPDLSSGEIFMCAWSKPHPSPAQPKVGRLDWPLSKGLQVEPHVLAVPSMTQ